MPLFIPVLYVLGGAVLRAAAPAAARALLSLGAKKVTTKAAQKIGGTIVTATPRILTKLKKAGPKGGPKARPKGKVTKPKVTDKSKVTDKPKGGPKAKPKREIPENVKVRKTKPGKGGPFAKRTKKQKEADAKREKIQAQNRKNDNRRNPSRDPKGKYSERPVGPSTVPKVKPKPKPMTRRGKLVRGGTAILTGTQLLDLKGSTPQPVTKKVTPKTGQGRPSMDKDKNKRKIPVVKPKKGPMKVRPKESDQPKKDQSFGAAFNEARREKKQPTFTWENPKTGKTGKYTTRLKEESIADHKKKFNVTGKY